MKSVRFAVLLLVLALAACGRGEVRPGTNDITGAMPDLAFNMVRANDGARVTPDDYRGKVVLLYFGYTHCPDACPTTLANLATVLQKLGSHAKQVRVLFVTVDPARDTLPILKAYVASFALQIDGLRGADDEIATLARRYRVLYRVTQTPSGGVEVMHASSTFVFDKDGHARLVTTSTDDTAAIAGDIARLLRSDS